MAGPHLGRRVHGAVQLQRSLQMLLGLLSVDRHQHMADRELQQTFDRLEDGQRREEPLKPRADALSKGKDISRPIAAVELRIDFQLLAQHLTVHQFELRPLILAQLVHVRRHLTQGTVRLQ